MQHDFYHDVPTDKREFIEDESDHRLKQHAMVQPIHERVDYEPDVPAYYYKILDVDNEMSTRTFPQIKP